MKNTLKIALLLNIITPSLTFADCTVFIPKKGCRAYRIQELLENHGYTRVYTEEEAEYKACMFGAQPFGRGAGPGHLHLDDVTFKVENIRTKKNIFYATKSKRDWYGTRHPAVSKLIRDFNRSMTRYPNSECNYLNLK